MVELIVWDFDEESELEKLLQEANIEYQLYLNMGHYGFQQPYIIVDGVPLDGKRAKRWIKEYKRNDY